MRWVLGPLVLFLAACGFLGSPPVEGELSPGEVVRGLSLPPAQGTDALTPGVKGYRLLLNQEGAVEVGVVSTGLGLQSRLRLLLLDERGVIQAVSVARHWFGAYPEIAPLGLGPQGIGVLPLGPGVRLNLRGNVGQFYLRVENYAPLEDTVDLYARYFSPDARGQGEPLALGATSGAIEFVGESDYYRLPSESGLYLRFAYAGPLDLVAKLYRAQDDPAPRTLNPNGCASLEGASLLVVRDRGLARAGFNEENSGRYRLEVSGVPCP